MSENEIKPVAWVERSENGHDRMWSHSLDAWANRPVNPEPLYSQSAIDRLTAERDAAVADAERYRWLVDSGRFCPSFYNKGWGLRSGAFERSTKESLDAAIDAARAEGGV